MYRTFHGELVDICILSRKIEGHLVCFFAQEGCQICKNIEVDLPKLFREFPQECFLKIDANNYRKIATKYNVKILPHFVFLKGTEGEPKLVGRCSGGNIMALRKSLRKFLKRGNSANNSIINSP